MAIVMSMKWPGVTLEQYEQVRVGTNFEADPPSGGVLHVAAHDGEGMRIVDVWDSADDFNRFVEQRLMPFVQQLGVDSQPDITILPAQNVWIPALAASDRPA